jgi:hypothetical protein
MRRRSGRSTRAPLRPLFHEELRHSISEGPEARTPEPCRRVGEIPNPRDFKANGLNFANTPVLLVQREDGRIRGFTMSDLISGNKYEAD